MKVLHVGCGPKNPAKLHSAFRTPEWEELRLDINPACKPDIVATMTAMPEVAAASVEAVWSSHNLEHLYPHDVPLALKEFRRVLKPGGFLLVTLPDLQEVAKSIAEDRLEDALYTSPAGPITPIDIVYGYRPDMAKGNLFMAHRCGFTAKTLGNALVTAGFELVTLQRDRKKFNLWAIAFTTHPSEEDLIKAQKAMFPLPISQ